VKDKKNIKKMAAIAVIALVIASVGLTAWNKMSRFMRPIKVSGNIEGNDVRISFRVGGQITELLADEGAVLKIGQTVARLNTDELSKIKNEAEAALKEAEANYKLASIDYVRAENLFQAGSISAQKRDNAKTNFDSLKAKVDKLKAQLELAVTRLNFAELESPLNGYITVKSAEQGEVVQTGAPVFTAIDLNDVWLTAYINETDLGRVKLNQEAYLITDTYPGKKYKGYVSFINQEAEFTPKFIQTTEERVKLVYRIKIKVDNSSLDLKPGMPADGYIGK
jgi:HlyD family secretion protein